jgi:hypothetical protein
VGVVVIRYLEIVFAFVWDMVFLHIEQDLFSIVVSPRVTMCA